MNYTYYFPLMKSTLPKPRMLGTRAALIKQLRLIFFGFGFASVASLPAAIVNNINVDFNASQGYVDGELSNNPDWTAGGGHIVDATNGTLTKSNTDSYSSGTYSKDTLNNDGNDGQSDPDEQRIITIRTAFNITETGSTTSSGVVYRIKLFKNTETINLSLLRDSGGYKVQSMYSGTGTTSTSSAASIGTNGTAGSNSNNIEMRGVLTKLSTGPNDWSFNAYLYDLDDQNKQLTIAYFDFTATSDFTNGDLGLGFEAGKLTSRDISDLEINNLVGTSVPEPTTFALLAGALSFIVIALRRRNR